MKIDGVPHRSIWVENDGAVMIIDQTCLPHRLEKRELETVEDAARAIATMQVRGAPLIGATAAYGIALAMRVDPSTLALNEAAKMLRGTRPTAINLEWALKRITKALQGLAPDQRRRMAFRLAAELCEEDIEINHAIGQHGIPLIQKIAKQKRDVVNILTHCNAGWIATVDWGTATSPIYQAHDLGIKVHVYVDETRPRNQGAHLTAWELGCHGVPHTLIVDNAGGHLMQHGLIDICITGADRVTRCGDVCNKIGTYLKALAAFDNGIPFYVALPSPTIDWSICDGLSEIPIEQRSGDEVAFVEGKTNAGVKKVQIAPSSTPVSNYAFDVTPARLITGFISEYGFFDATPDALAKLHFAIFAGAEKRLE